ncbi:hypothetical protein A6F68_00289 [Tsuneonella dongtanensis]|uniref:Bacterial Pleckstrin homology domain-containing protein n=1 Tax=Tsuneonella dongtanensis TaxID=692370 RepID=A0A1B2A9R1_9SPHN|nr:hypothetical protein [Tsuneonella dongtanensis]ANY18824.1 hypothetical protein A6F68_00289 [Tsuneonella dongtanensis]
MTGKLIQMGASLIAILALAWIALKLGLGGDTRIRDDDHLRELAEEALCGFDPVDIAIDRAGLAALARDADGRVMLLRRHGAHFASRLLDGHAHVRLDRHFLIVGTSDRRFGEITLDLGDAASAWAASLRRL